MGGGELFLPFWRDFGCKTAGAWLKQVVVRGRGGCGVAAHARVRTGFQGDGKGRLCIPFGISSRRIEMADVLEMPSLLRVLCPSLEVGIPFRS